MSERFDRHGIGMAIVWGDTPGDSKRKAAIRKEQEDRFWTDPKCRVAVGTSAIERSLNFQVARIVVDVDHSMNPQRMIQILGRIRRAGSRTSGCIRSAAGCRYARGPVPERPGEAGCARRLRVRRSNPLYKQLSPMELSHLISPTVRQTQWPPPCTPVRLGQQAADRVVHWTRRTSSRRATNTDVATRETGTVPTWRRQGKHAGQDQGGSIRAIEVLREALRRGGGCPSHARRRYVRRSATMEGIDECLRMLGHRDLCCGVGPARGTRRGPRCRSVRACGWTPSAVVSR